MKKILLVILTLTLVFGLGACNNAPTEDYATKSELELLEIEIEALQERIDNLVVVRGLNGQVIIYENQSLYDELEASLVTLSVEYMVVKDTFDKAKDAPDYIKNDAGGYISFEDLGGLLQAKYFGENTLSAYDKFTMGSKAFMQFELSGVQDTNDIFAKTIILIEEIRNYSFYVLSCSELEISLIYDNSVLTIIIPLVVVINDYFEITLNGIYDGDYEMRIEMYQTTIDEELSQAFYNGYILDELFNGYVLNYTK